mgnify:CR=1 FL=1
MPDMWEILLRCHSIPQALYLLHSCHNDNTAIHLHILDVKQYLRHNTL